MSKGKAEEIVARLLSEASGINFGEVSVCLKIHSGRVVSGIYTITESMKEVGVGAAGAKKADHEE